MNLHLVNILKDRLGPQNLIHVEPRFESVNDKRVLVIKCTPSHLPVYLKDGNMEQFFVRTGAATTELIPSQIQAYIKQRFSANVGYSASIRFPRGLFMGPTITSRINARVDG